MFSQSTTLSKHKRELVQIINDGSAKTYVYRDLDEGGDHESFWDKLFHRHSNHNRPAKNS
jgi:hypothetical protein